MEPILLHGECLEVMKTLPDKSVDLFLCDLPYGCLTGGGGQEKHRRRFQNGTDTGTLITQKEGVIAGCSWDIPIDLNAFWIQVKRLCRDDHTPVLMFCSTKFGFELYNSNPEWFRYDLVWNKQRGVSFLQANKMPMRSHEMMYVFAKKGARYYRKDIEVEGAKEWRQFGTPSGSGVYSLVRDNPVVRPVGTITSKEGVRCVKSVVHVSTELKKGQHPTQKPANLYAWLIERYSKEGDTILDPTAGSFTSVITAHALGRTAIGIEKDKDFYDKAVSSLPKT